MSQTVSALHPFPTSIDAVTPQWLSAAISQRFPGIIVTDVEFDNIVQSTATKMRLKLRYNEAGNAAGLPSQMYMKGGFSIAHEYDSAASGYASESMFYRDVAPSLSIPLPACYFADIDPGNGQALLLLEDLSTRGVTFGSNLQPLAQDTLRQGLELLAKVHAHWWNAPQLSQLTQYPGVLGDIGLQLLDGKYLEECLAKPRARAVPPELRTLDAIVTAQKTLWSRRQNEVKCLIHGDTHLGNWYFEATGEPRLLDWQGILRGNWAHDVTYFMIGSQAIEDRRRHERELLQHYLDALRGCGVDAPSFAEAWQLYRENAMYGFMWLLNPVVMQGEDITEACSVRFSTAVSDLDTLSALGLR